MAPSDVTLLALAYTTDLAIGDPRWLPHPVRGMGLMIAWGERLLRRLIPPARPGDSQAGGWERAAGAALTVLVVGSSAFAAWWLISTCATLAWWAGFAVSAVLLFTCLSTRDLARESWQVLRALEADDLLLARRRVARIVGRDTDRLDGPEIVRATLETIAESTLDGILSPLFFFAIGGVPGAVAYKAINTLDSMVGHRSARYIRFGWAAARLDTLANWLPARWSPVVFAVASGICGYRARESWRIAWRDGSMGTVPNAGLPEGALAGALGVRLGGVNWYQGHATTMPFLGDAHRPLEPERIREAIRLMYTASGVGLVMTFIAVAAKSTW